jgi:hypothetical protein
MLFIHEYVWYIVTVPINVKGISHGKYTIFNEKTIF